MKRSRPIQTDHRSRAIHSSATEASSGGKGDERSKIVSFMIFKLAARSLTKSFHAIASPMMSRYVKELVNRQ